MQRFRWTIEKKDDNTLYIESFLPITVGNGERKNWLYLSIQSIPELCSKLTEDVVFNFKIPEPIQNSTDYITFSYSASRERPAINIVGDHKIGGRLEEGIIHIPIHTFGDKELNMTYITPLLEDLKKYI